MQWTITNPVSAYWPVKRQKKLTCVSASRAGLVLCTRQVEHHTSFLKSDDIASFSFGECTVQMAPYFCGFCENTVNFHIFCLPTDSSKCVDHYGFTWTEEWWMCSFNGRY